MPASTMTNERHCTRLRRGWVRPVSPQRRARSGTRVKTFSQFLPCPTYIDFITRPPAYPSANEIPVHTPLSSYSFLILSVHIDPIDRTTQISRIDMTVCLVQFDPDGLVQVSSNDGVALSGLACGLSLNRRKPVKSCAVDAVSERDLATIRPPERIVFLVNF